MNIESNFLSQVHRQQLIPHTRASIADISPILATQEKQVCGFTDRLNVRGTILYKPVDVHLTSPCGTQFVGSNLSHQTQTFISQPS